jgi:hypothetical protein
MLPPMAVSLRVAGTAFAVDPDGPCCRACSLCNEAVLALIEDLLLVRGAATAGAVLGADVFPTEMLSTFKKLITSTLV